MPWRLIDKFPQNVNGFRYVSENRDKFWICSYRQPGSVIMFSTVPGHVETVVLLSQRRPDTTIDVNLDISELEVSRAKTKATYEEIKS